MVETTPGANVGQALRDAVMRLTPCSTTPRLDAEVLLGHVLDRNRAWLRAHEDAPLDAQVMASFNALLQRRINLEPVAYLTGVQEFWSLPLKVAPHTLIPRPDTERLVEAALGVLPATRCDVLDLGTGTGAVALALKQERPFWQVVAVDRLPEAAALASENAARCGLVIEVRVSDWYENVNGQRFDLIVSNPPYIEDNDPHLTGDGVCHEPLSALVAAAGGMADLYTIVDGAPAYLTQGGWLAVEHGFTQAGRVAERFRQAGFAQVQTFRDLAGQSRVTLGCWQPAGEQNE